MYIYIHTFSCLHFPGQCWLFDLIPQVMDGLLYITGGRTTKIKPSRKLTELYKMAYYL